MRYFKSIWRPICSLLLLILVSAELVLSAIETESNTIEYFNTADAGDETDEQASVEFSSAENAEKFIEFFNLCFGYSADCVKSTNRYYIFSMPQPYASIFSRPPRQMS